MIGDKVIKKFPVMLASPEKFLDRIKFPAIVQLKADGMRCNIIKRNDKTYVYSRNGKLMKMHGVFDDLIDDNEIVLDGELLIYEGGTPLDRKTGNGILHKAVVGTISKEETRDIMFNGWDCIPYEHWIRGESDIPYRNRFDALTEQLSAWHNGHVISSTMVKDMKTAKGIYNGFIKNGYEGIILKNIDHPWENKRSKNCIKMKEFSEMDLKIVDWVEGEGKYVGMLGKFICENKDGSIRVGVGTGYNDKQRKEYTRDLIGKICAVKYNTIITRKDKDTKSLFLPVFIELRDDKDNADG